MVTIGRLEPVDYQFEKNSRSLIAVDAGWKENGYSVYEVQAEDGTVIDTVMVHPLDDIQSTIAEWRKN